MLRWREREALLGLGIRQHDARQTIHTRPPLPGVDEQVIA